MPIEVIEARVLMSTDFIVTTTADAGAGSLRQAILSANATPNTAEDADYILFNLGAGVHTITPLTPLPPITDPVTIDGTSDDENLTPSIELNGSSAGAGANGLVLASSDPVLASFITGLIINRFSGNGIRITGDSNGVGVCYIGTNAAGTAAGAGNGGHGILIESDNNFASDNIIAFNGGDGVAVINNGSGNDVSINNIYNNGGLGIDLGDNGRTANDVLDPDTGANDLQNFPVITAVTPATAPATGMVVSGTVNSTANTDLDIAIYSNPNTDGEGQTFIDHVQVRTDAAGNATWSIAATTSTASDIFTATATRLFILPNLDEFAISTSEFSDPFPVGPVNPPISEVYVRGTTWLGQDNNAGTTTFMEYLEAKGLGDDVMGYRLMGPGRTPPASNPEDIIPWINADQIVLRYATAPTGAGIPTAGTMTVRGLNQAASSYTVTAVAQVPGDNRAYVLTLNKPLGGGNPATGVAPTSAENGDQITLAGPGGPAGGNFSLLMHVLQGDTDHLNETSTTHAVLARDFSEVKKKFFKETTSEVTGTDTDYSVFHDVDASGSILARDFSEVKKRFFQELPAPPVAAAGSLDLSGVTRDIFGVAAIL